MTGNRLTGRKYTEVSFDVAEYRVSFLRRADNTKGPTVGTGVLERRGPCVAHDL
jgi:hypothetical protein